MTSSIFLAMTRVIHQFHQSQIKIINHRLPTNPSHYPLVQERVTPTHLAQRKFTYLHQLHLHHHPMIVATLWTIGPTHKCLDPHMIIHIPRWVVVVGWILCFLTLALLTSPWQDQGLTWQPPDHSLTPK